MRNKRNTDLEFLFKIEKEIKTIIDNTTFKVGDFLIVRHGADKFNYDAPCTLQDLDIEMLNKDTAQKYIVVFVSTIGSTFVQEVKPSSTDKIYNVTGPLICISGPYSHKITYFEHMSVEFYTNNYCIYSEPNRGKSVDDFQFGCPHKWELDPDYVDHILLLGDSEKFNPYRKITEDLKDKREKDRRVVEHNKTLAAYKFSHGEPFEERKKKVRDFLRTLKVGDKYWVSHKKHFEILKEYSTTGIQVKDQNGLIILKTANSNVFYQKTIYNSKPLSAKEFS